MDFGAALDGLKAGVLMRRDAWGDKIMCVALIQDPRDETRPVFHSFSRRRQWQPGFVPSATDILADDWQVTK